jgi:phage recombination protein Bet
MANDLIVKMAESTGLSAADFEATIRNTVFPKEGTQAQFFAFLMTAREYGLNPITREIHAVISKGKVVSIVGIDGWLKLMNTHPMMDGMEVAEVDRDGRVYSATCRIYRKDRQHATEVTERFVECRRDTEPWKQYPARMLRHKAVMQCARYAFGFAGIVDQDEADDMARNMPAEKDITPPENEFMPAPKKVVLRGDATVTPAAEVAKPAAESEPFEPPAITVPPVTQAREPETIDHATGEVLPPEKGRRAAVGANACPSEKQMKAIHAIAARKGLVGEAFDGAFAAKFGCKLSDLPVEKVGDAMVWAGQ